VGDDVGVVEVRGENELDGDGATAIFAMLLARDRERADIGEPARVEIGDGGGEHVVAVEVEQLDGAGDAQAEARSGDGPSLDDAVERGHDRAEAIAAFVDRRKLRRDARGDREEFMSATVTSAEHERGNDTQEADDLNA